MVAESAQKKLNSHIMIFFFLDSLIFWKLDIFANWIFLQDENKKKIMVVLYVRHSDDSRRRQESQVIHRDDLKLTQKGRSLARKTSRYLIGKYGQPDIIYLSPFMRSKETLGQMQKYFTKKPIVKFDNRLSRFFSKKEKEDPSCFTETFAHNIPIQENWHQFKQRVQYHLREMYEKDYIHSKKVIWCITHALPFIQVADICKKTIPKSIPFMHYFRVRRSKCKHIENFFKIKNGAITKNNTKNNGLHKNKF